MDKTTFYGEILKGHAGQYCIFSYPEGMRSDTISAILKDTLPSDESRCNLTFRSLTVEGKELLVFGFGAAQTNSTVGAHYQHAVFVENTEEVMQSEYLREAVFFRFAKEDEFSSVVADPNTFCSGRAPFKGFLPETPEKLNVSDEKLAELACASLYFGITDSLGKLVILVPENVNYEGYCRSVMYELFRCVPLGLRKYLSFCTNSAEQGGNFVIAFEKESKGKSLSGKQLVCLEKEDWSLSNSFRSEIQSLVLALTKDPALSKLIFEQVESGTNTRRIPEEYYAAFWRRYALQGEEPSWELLGRYTTLLGEKLTERERNLLKETIRSRFAKDNCAEKLMLTDPAFKQAETIGELDKALDSYSQIFGVLGRTLPAELTQGLLLRYLPEGEKTLEQALAQKELLESCRNAKMGGILSAEAVQKVENRIKDEVEQGNRNKKNTFLESIPAEWNFERLKTLVDTLVPCEDSVKKTCFETLADKAIGKMEVLEKDGQEDTIEPFYQKVLALVGQAAGQKMTDWYASWSAQDKKRRGRLEKIADFTAYFAQTQKDPKSMDYLIKNMKKNNSCAGVDAFLLAAEMKYRTSWCSLKDKLCSDLEQMEQEGVLGIRLDKEKTWEDLLSEAYACRELLGKADICLWDGKTKVEKTKGISLDEVCQTLEILYDLERDKEPETEELCNHRVVRALKNAGLVRKADFAKLKFVLKPESYSLFGRKYAVKKRSRINKKLWILIPAGGVLVAVLILIGTLSLLNRPSKEQAPEQTPESVVSQENIIANAPDEKDASNLNGQEEDSNPDEQGETDPGAQGETDPGEQGETDPGEQGETDPGEQGETDPGEQGETNPDEQDDPNSDTQGETNPGEQDESDPGTQGTGIPGVTTTNEIQSSEENQMDGDGSV